MITEAEYKKALQVVSAYRRQINDAKKERQQVWFVGNLANAETKITDCNFTTRTMNCLHGNRFRTLGDLQGFSKKKLLRFPNLGEASLKEIETVLLVAGIVLEP